VAVGGFVMGDGTNPQPEPYYADDWVTIYHGDCRELLPELRLEGEASLVVDPPYGADYETNRPGRPGRPRRIAADGDVGVRSWLLTWWGHRGPNGPALVFGTWKVNKPTGTRGVLIWDKGGALGMGDLSLPWKFDHEEIYVLGAPFAGKRDCGSVLRHPPVQAVGREHPNEKPVGLMSMLLAKLPPVPVVDPCCGTGPTLVAAKARGRQAIGIELEERYCEVAAKRLAQGALDFGGAA
jgi:DNA modification methylase